MRLSLSCRRGGFLEWGLGFAVVTPQPMAESSGRDTRRIRLLKRIHNNYIAIIFITFVIPY
ncbi:hypothetical protein Hanom_Chr14g01296781 [Helianthus anomalus]